MLKENFKQKEVDSIYFNGKIYTVNAKFQIVEAIAIYSGMFVAIGTNADILSHQKAKTIIDLKKMSVYPGFIDSHCHQLDFGSTISFRIDLSKSVSLEAMLERVAKFASQCKKEWILGFGWNQFEWKEQNLPNKHQLDNISKNRPIALKRIDGHAMVVNSKVLQMANISLKTKIEGGEFLIEKGELTGLLIDNAMSVIEKIIPPWNNEEIEISLLTAQKQLFTVGLTTIADAGSSESLFHQIDELQKNKKLQLRVYGMILVLPEDLPKFEEKGLHLQKTNYLSLKSVKILTDGALGSQGAWLKEPQDDAPNKTGLKLFNEENISRIGQLCLQKGFQLNSHAIGDRANNMVLTEQGKLLKDKNDLRWRIEHSQCLLPDDINLFGKQNIIPSVQPTHATSDLEMAPIRLGEKRLISSYVQKQLLDQNGWLVIGSDFPVESINPIYGFYAAVTRKTLNGKPENGFQIENALSREEALKGMTIWAAKGLFEENVKGSIELGKFADFVILDQDLLEIPVEIIPSSKVLKTVLNGDIVYEKTN